jgi:hypothetical protein
MKDAGLADELAPAALAPPKPCSRRSLLETLPTDERIAVWAGSIMSEARGVHCKCVLVFGGEGGIRTHGTLAGPTVFKTAAFDHSATSPVFVVHTTNGSV